MKRKLLYKSMAWILAASMIIGNAPLSKAEEESSSITTLSTASDTKDLPTKITLGEDSGEARIYAVFSNVDCSDLKFCASFADGTEKAFGWEDAEREEYGLRALVSYTSGGGKDTQYTLRITSTIESIKIDCAPSFEILSADQHPEFDSVPVMKLGDTIAPETSWNNKNYWLISHVIQVDEFGVYKFPFTAVEGMRFLYRNLYDINGTALDCFDSDNNEILLIPGYYVCTYGAAGQDPSSVSMKKVDKEIISCDVEKEVTLPELPYGEYSYIELNVPEAGLYQVNSTGYCSMKSQLIRQDYYSKGDRIVYDTPGVYYYKVSGTNFSINKVEAIKKIEVVSWPETMVGYNVVYGIMPTPNNTTLKGLTVDVTFESGTVKRMEFGTNSWELGNVTYRAIAEDETEIYHCKDGETYYYRCSFKNAPEDYTLKIPFIMKAESEYPHQISKGESTVLELNSINSYVALNIEEPGKYIIETSGAGFYRYVKEGDNWNTEMAEDPNHPGWFSTIEYPAGSAITFDTPGKYYISLTYFYGQDQTVTLKGYFDDYVDMKVGEYLYVPEGMLAKVTITEPGLYEVNTTIESADGIQRKPNDIILYSTGRSIMGTVIEKPGDYYLKGSSEQLIGVCKEIGNTVKATVGETIQLENTGMQLVAISVPEAGTYQIKCSNTISYLREKVGNDNVPYNRAEIVSSKLLEIFEAGNYYFLAGNTYVPETVSVEKISDGALNKVETVTIPANRIYYRDFGNDYSNSPNFPSYYGTVLQLSFSNGDTDTVYFGVFGEEGRYLERNYPNIYSTADDGWNLGSTYSWRNIRPSKELELGVVFDGFAGVPVMIDIPFEIRNKVDAQYQMTAGQTIQIDDVAKFQALPKNLFVLVKAEVDKAGYYTIKMNDANGKYSIYDAEDNAVALNVTDAEYDIKFQEAGTYYIAVEPRSELVTFSLEAIPELEITKQPASVTAKDGEKVTFTVEANGAKTYQWQYSKDGGKTWANNTATSTAKTANFTITAKETLDGRVYRCVVTGVNGKVISETASLKIKEALAIIEQPADVTVMDGETAKFTVAANDEGLTYQWQYSKDGGKTWTNNTVSSAKKATLSLTAKQSFHGRIYHCIVTNADGETVTSEAASLTVNAAFKIVSQPTDAAAMVSETAKFTVEAIGQNLMYQWQYSKDGINWTNSTAASAKTATLSTTVKASFDGRNYRCIVTSDGGQIISETASLTVITEKFGITTQPVDVTAVVGETAQFGVAATGENLTYQWQYSKDGINWTNSTAASAKTATLSTTVKASFSGRQYRCIVSNAGEQVISETAILMVGAAQPAITGQPADVTVAVGETAQFSVAATGENLTYQWQYSKDGVNWTNSTAASAKTAILSTTVKASFSGRQYRCVVTAANGEVISASAVLTVQ